jgi:hypothetical protein
MYHAPVSFIDAFVLNNDFPFKRSLSIYRYNTVATLSLIHVMFDVLVDGCNYIGK